MVARGRRESHTLHPHPHPYLRLGTGTGKSRHGFYSRKGRQVVTTLSFPNHALFAFRIGEMDQNGSKEKEKEKRKRKTMKKAAAMEEEEEETAEEEEEKGRPHSLRLDSYFPFPHFPCKFR